MLLQKTFFDWGPYWLKRSILNLIQISLDIFYSGLQKCKAWIKAICFWKAKFKNKNSVRLIWLKVPVTTHLYCIARVGWGQTQVGGGKVNINLSQVQCLQI